MMTDSLLKEVDDALRADRATAAWQKHKKTLIAAVAAIILAAAANSAFEHYREAKGGEALRLLGQNQALLENGKVVEAAAGFAAIAAQQSGELRELALLWQARALIAGEQREGALAALQSASSGNSLWADMACLRLVGLSEQAPVCLQSMAASPLANERAQWRTASQWQAGETDKAMALLDQLIADPNTTQAARARMMQWQAVMHAGKKAE